MACAGHRREPAPSVVAKGEAGLPWGQRSPEMDSAIYERPQQMSESGMHATNIGLVTACIGLGTGAYTGPLPARMGVSPMFALGPVATIGSGGPRTAFS